MRRVHIVCSVALAADVADAVVHCANPSATWAGGLSIAGLFDLSDSGSPADGVANSNFSLDVDGTITRPSSAHGSRLTARALCPASFDGHARYFCSAHTPGLYFRAATNSSDTGSLPAVSSYLLTARPGCVAHRSASSQRQRANAFTAGGIYNLSCSIYNFPACCMQDSDRAHRRRERGAPAAHPMERVQRLPHDHGSRV